MSDRLPASKHGWQEPPDTHATRKVVSRAVEEAIQKSVAEWRKADVDLDAYNTYSRKRSGPGDASTGSWDRTTPPLRNQLWNPTWLGLHAFFPKRAHSAVLAGVEGLDLTAKLPADQQKLLG